ncbi:hypothetical protein ACP2AV_05095 [Aliiroseovarius sp. PTFE2010]|uniref:hypothetical protein n=1 Tax=Aliiroseovarius sp. PTFE2010 TaxID=3417190 RepID=UPI003CF16481
MTRRFVHIILTSAFVLAAMIGPGMAQGAQDRVVEQLKDQGYARIQITRTLLGRTRIVATGNAARREIILNTNTGEILRDYWELDSRGPAAQNAGSSSLGGSIISVPQTGSSGDSSGGHGDTRGHASNDDDSDDDDDDSDGHSADDDDSDDDSNGDSDDADNGDDDDD